MASVPLITRSGGARRHLALLLLLALVPRLVHLRAPITGHHAWRQADTAAIAWNFHDNGFRLLHPQIDWRGATSGEVECEFPLYSYLTALAFRAFGPADVWGRWLSILCGLATIAVLYALVRRVSGAPVALWSAGFYACAPLNVYFSRAVMPESMMLLCSVTAVLAFLGWTRGGRRRDFIVAAGATTLAVLLKLPALYLGLPLLFLAWRRFGARTFREPRLWLFALLVLGPVVLWYAHAHSLYQRTGLTFGIWGAGRDKWGDLRPLGTLAFYNDVFFKSIAERHLTWAAVVPFLAGLFRARRSPDERLFDAWLVAVLVYFGVVAVGNRVHDYYQLPLVLPAAFFVGRAFDHHLGGCWRARHARPPLRARSRGLALVLGACLVAIPILSTARLVTLWRKEARDWALFHLAAAVEQRVPPGDLVVAVDRGDPIWLYRARRRGWHARWEDLEPERLDALRAAGARWVVGPTAHFAGPGGAARLDELRRRYEAVAATSEYVVLALDAATR